MKMADSVLLSLFITFIIKDTVSSIEIQLLANLVDSILLVKIRTNVRGCGVEEPEARPDP